MNRQADALLREDLEQRGEIDIECSSRVERLIESVRLREQRDDCFRLEMEIYADESVSMKSRRAGNLYVLVRSSSGNSTDS